LYKLKLTLPQSQSGGGMENVVQLMGRIRRHRKKGYSVMSSGGLFFRP